MNLGNVEANAFNAALKFLDFYKNKLGTKDGVLYFYIEELGIYSSELSYKRNVLQKYNKELTMESNSGKKINFGIGVNATNLLTELESIIITKKIEFGKERKKESYKMALYSNGIYNIHTGEFKEGYDPYYIFYEQIPREFPKRENFKNDDINWVKNFFFNDPFNDNSGQFLLNCIALAMLGVYVDRHILFALGKSGCSKSLLYSMLSNLPGLVSTFYTHNIQVNTGNDPTLQNNWVSTFIDTNVKIVVASECSSSDKAVDGTKMKTLSSGGSDKVAYRELYKKFVERVNTAVMLIFTNCIPPISGADEALKSRVKIIQYYYQFVKQIKEKFHKIADKKAEEKLRSDYFQGCFDIILFEACLEVVKANYEIEEPPQIAENIAHHIQTDLDLFNEKFDEFCEVTDNDLLEKGSKPKNDNDLDWIYFDEIREIFKGIFNDNKLYKLLSEKGLTKIAERNHKKVRLGVRKRIIMSEELL